MVSQILWIIFWFCVPHKFLNWTKVIFDFHHCLTLKSLYFCLVESQLVSYDVMYFERLQICFAINKLLYNKTNNLWQLTIDITKTCGDLKISINVKWIKPKNCVALVFLFLGIFCFFCFHLKHDLQKFKSWTLANNTKCASQFSLIFNL